MNDLVDDTRKNQIEAYGPAPVVNDRRTRILPFLDPKTGEPMFTLVQEWFDKDGNITRDSRHWMSEVEFLCLCASAATAYNRLKEWFDYERKVPA
jgi:hypothetical protein